MECQELYAPEMGSGFLGCCIQGPVRKLHVACNPSRAVWPELRRQGTSDRIGGADAGGNPVEQDGVAAGPVGRTARPSPAFWSSGIACGRARGPAREGGRQGCGIGGMGV